jgi:hypothetical protein
MDYICIEWGPLGNAPAYTMLFLFLRPKHMKIDVLAHGSPFYGTK